MINYVESMPAAEAAAAASQGGASETTTAASRGEAADTVATGQAAFTAPAYLPSGAAPRGFSSSASAAAGAYEPETVDACASRFGPQYALIRAALPSTLQHQLDAQVAAANSPVGGDAAADEGRPAFSERDLARLVRSSIAESDDGVASLLVTRLARAIARSGAAAIYHALHLADGRIAFAAAGTTPGTVCEQRARRREGDRGRERERRQPDRTVPDERVYIPDPKRDDRPLAITDTVYFGGAAVATLSSPLPALNDERKLL